jgi:hypothetical protein
MVDRTDVAAVPFVIVFWKPGVLNLGHFVTDWTFEHYLFQ